MIFGDTKLAILGFVVLNLGILILAFAKFFIEEQRGLFWSWRNIAELDEAIYEFNIFSGLSFIVCGCLCIIAAKQFFSKLDEIILLVLLGLLFIGSVIFIIYFNLRFVKRGK